MQTTIVVKDFVHLSRLLFVCFSCVRTKCIALFGSHLKDIVPVLS